MSNFIKISTLILLTALSIACSDSKSNKNLDIVKAEITTKGIKEITVSDLTNQVLDEQLIIDIRELDELHGGVIPDSIHIPMGIIASELPKYLQKNASDKDINELKNTPILLYCRSGRRSYNSAETLQKLGFTNVSSLNGGFNAYKKSKN